MNYNNLILLTLLPIVITMGYAIVAKMKQKETKDVLALLLCGSALILNALLVFHISHEVTVPLWLKILQSVLMPTIVPTAYRFSARLVGHNTEIGFTTAMWLVMGLMLIPSIRIDISPFSELLGEYQQAKLMTLSIYDAGLLRYEMPISSLVLMIQTLMAIQRIPVLMRMIHEYELSMTSGVKSYLGWWIAALVLVLSSAFTSMDVLVHPIYRISFFCVYMILVSGMFIHVGKRVDLHGLVTEQDESVKLDEFIIENKRLAEQARRLILENRLYLQPTISVEEIASMLGTSRIHFTRMMRVEFGMSYNEYATKERLNLSKQLLLQSDMTIATIADKCAMGDVGTFSRLFRRETGSLPETWRKERMEIEN